MTPILAPHKQQDGWCYIRVPHRFVGHNDGYEWLPVPCFFNGSPVLNTAIEGHYSDENPQERVISSRRVEEDVETGDYLKRCADEGLSAIMWPGLCDETRWVVVRQGGSSLGAMTWPTLREAYHRCKAVPR